MAVVAVALSPPVEARADATLAAHMVQHVAMAMVAAPLLAAGLPRWAWLRRVPALVGWVAFAASGWLVHFSPLFQAATEHLAVHVFEHGVLLGAGVLFWAQVTGPGATLSHPLRLLYLVVAMPQNTFVALAIFSSRRALYPHYGDGAPALADQRLAGGIMWVAGDLVLLAAVLLLAAAWARHEQVSEAAADRLPSPRTAG